MMDAIAPTGLSLWLIPSQPCKSQIQTIINDVADAERSPKFEPHMTVVSVECPNAVPPLDACLSPILRNFERLRLGFKELFIGTDYFVSVAIALSPSGPLLEFRREIVEAVTRELGVPVPEKPFFPHISLHYGDIAAEDRERIASHIRTKGVESGNWAGLKIGGVVSNLPDELWVVKTEGPVESWEVLEMIQF